MAGIKIVGRPGIVEARKARLDHAVRHLWKAATTPPEKPVRWLSAGALGKRLQTPRLA
jgi:hypothetical protein